MPFCSDNFFDDLSVHSHNFRHDFEYLLAFHTSLIVNGWGTGRFNFTSRGKSEPCIFRSRVFGIFVCLTSRVKQ